MIRAKSSKPRPGISRALPRLLVAWAVSSALTSGCGYIAEDDLIVIARMDGEAIRRGDLREALREMTDEERPLIQNKGDLQRARDRYIDDRIKTDLAKRLAEQGHTLVSREVAREAYFAKNPDYRQIANVRDPTVLDMSQGELDAMLNEIEFGVDDEEERLKREAAVEFKVREAAQQRLFSITEEEFEREFGLRRTRLKRFESVEFIAIRFATDLPGALEEAGALVRRINEDGEDFDGLFQQYRQKDPGAVTRSSLENNPASVRFRSFWVTASGTKAGDVLGPVYLPPTEQLLSDGSVQQMPDAWLVLKVLEHRAETNKNLEEAKPELAAFILRRKVMDALRAEHDVEIYADKLWDPAGYGDQFKDSFIDTSE